MLTREEGERLAQAISALRADWPTASLLSFIADRKTRPYRDLALELTYVALDPATNTPARIDQDGPWKQLARVTGSAPTPPPLDFDTVCATCLKPLGHLDHGNTGRPNDHDFYPPADYHRDVNHTRTTRTPDNERNEA